MDREKEIMKAALQLIVNLGFDYDGYSSVEGLKGLIDELVEIARDALIGKSPTYYCSDGYIRDIFGDIVH